MNNFCRQYMNRNSIILAATCFLISLSGTCLAITYTHGEIHTGKAHEQTVITARLYNRLQSDLVVVNVSEDDVRSMQIYRLTEGKYDNTPHVSILLNPDLIFMDKGNVDGSDQLLFFTESEILKWNPETMGLESVVEISSIYNARLYRSLPKVNLVRDVNGDNRDDVLIPDFDGYWLYLQKEKGGFKDRVKLKLDPVMELSFNKYPLYQNRRLYKGDHDLDGRSDMLFWDGSQLVIFYQKKAAQYQTAPVFYKPQVSMEYETADRISFGSRDQRTSATFLYEITDMDGDEIIDMITLSVESKGLFKKKTTYDIYKGQSSSNGVVFSDTPATSIESRGVQFNLVEKDFDGDGQMEVELSAVEIGVGKIISALITGGVSLDLEFYRMQEGIYPTSPIASRKIKAEINFSSGKVFFPSVLTADVSGDGLDDLIVQHRKDKLRIFTGTGDENLFSKKPVTIDLEMSTEPTFLDPQDLNGDGKLDMMMKFTSEEGERGIKTLIFN